jgi:hypothetical protein
MVIMVICVPLAFRRGYSGLFLFWWVSGLIYIRHMSIKCICLSSFPEDSIHLSVIYCCHIYSLNCFNCLFIYLTLVICIFNSYSSNQLSYFYFVCRYALPRCIAEVLYFLCICFIFISIWFTPVSWVVMR